MTADTSSSTPSRLLPLAVVLSMTAALIVAYLQLDLTTPFDEQAHLDYVVSIAADGRVPPPGATLGQESLREFACRGGPFAGLVCGAPTQDASGAPLGGENYETVYPATYYLLTAVPTAAIHAIWPDRGWLNSARIATSLWLLAAAGLTTALAQRLRAAPAAAGAAGVGLATTPLVLTTGAAVGSDVAAVALSLATVVVWLAATDSRAAWRLSATGALAVIALTIKPTSLAAVIVVALLEWRLRAGEGARLPRASRPSTWGPAAGWLLAVAAAYSVAVDLIDPLLRGPAAAVTPRLGEMLTGMQLTITSLLADAYGSVVTGLWWNAGSPLGDVARWWEPALGPPFLAMTVLVAITTGLGLVVSAVRTPLPWWGDEAATVRWASLAGLLLLPLVLVLSQHLAGAPPVWQDRFLLPAGALGFASVCAWLAHRWGLALAAVVGVLWLGAMVDLLL